MKRAANPRPSAKNESGEYANFQNALKHVLSVPRSEMKARLAEEKKRKPKRASSSRASHEKD